MAKKNWRDSGKAPEPNRSKGSDRSGWSSSRGASSVSWFGRALFLLAAAGLLGVLFKVFWPEILPEKRTPIVFLQSFPNSNGEQLFSTDAFAKEVSDQIGQTSNLLKTTDESILKGNLRSEFDVTANKTNVVLFYVYADLFADAKGEPFLLAGVDTAVSSPAISSSAVNSAATGQSAISPSANLPLREFLAKICEQDLGQGAPDTNQRIVILDCGRLDPTAFSTIEPEALADSVKKTFDALRESNVANSDRLWILLATDDYQLGWTSPELNGSVFGYFFSRGLMGEADVDDDKVVTLAELSTYVRESVARWVLDYRDSVQTPLLLPGDLQRADNIQLIHHLAQKPEAISGFENAKSMELELWKQAFDLPQPHLRQMICSQLVRLEQLRYCKTVEYKNLKDNIQRLLEASVVPLAKNNTTTVFEFLTPDQRQDALSPDAISEFNRFLNPGKSTEPTEPGTTPSKSSPSPNSDANAKAVGDKPSVSPEDAPSKKQPGRIIQTLSGPQRLALVWTFFKLHSGAAQSLDDKQLNQALEFVGDDLCKSFVEFQLLVILQNGLPWQKENFDRASFQPTVQCFDASQSLVLGITNSDRQAAGMLSNPNTSWINWRHINSEFQRIEHDRRTALDRAIAGTVPDESGSLDDLQQEYQQLAKKLGEITSARKKANDLLFVLPYLKSFVLRHAIYRHSQATEPFCISLADIEKLQNCAVELIALVTGPAMTADEIKRVVDLSDATEIPIGQVREALKEIVGGLKTDQPASNYVFQAQNLLLTPIPEWIDEHDRTTTVSTRKAVLDQLDNSLQKQQSTYFNSTESNDPTVINVDQIAKAFQTTAQNRLSEYQTLKWAESDASLTQPDLIQNWSDVQLSVDRLNHLRPGPEFLTFNDETALVNEVSRLDKTGGSIRLSNPSLGLLNSPLDVHYEQVLLAQADGQLRMMDRALRDFWGAGAVYGFRDLRSNPPPFMQRVQLHRQSFDALAESLQDFKAYETTSLVALATGIVTQAEKAWENLNNYHPVWQLDGSPVPDDENPIMIKTADQSDWLTVDLEAGNPQRQGNDSLPDFLLSDGRLMVGRKIQIQDQWYFDRLEVPASLTHQNLSGTICFRGHQFLDRREIARKRDVPVPEKIFTFRPPIQPNTRSAITVRNKDPNQVDLIFLLDCSASMRGPKLEKVKQTVKTVMLQLVNERRFHFGLAAFGHRGAYKEDANGKMISEQDEKSGKEIIGWTSDPPGHNPFDDWEMLFPVRQEISDRNNVTEINELLIGLKARGITPLYYSIGKTLQKFDNFPGRNQILIVVTDGDDTQNWDQRAIPEGKIATTLGNLAKAFQASVGKIEVVVLHINTNEKSSPMPPNFEVIRLGQNTQEELQNAIFSKVGRYRFSVTKQGKQVTDADNISMNDTRELEVDPGATYTIETHDVPHPAQYELKLFGGETYNFNYYPGELKLDQSETSSATERFISQVKVPFGTDNYQVGLFQQMNLDNNLRIGFAKTLGVGQYPDRVWARIKAQCTDGQLREFEMTRPAQEFSGIPAYAFRMPTGLAASTVDLTLFVKPDYKVDVPKADQPAGAAKLQGKNGECFGLHYQIAQNAAQPDQFDVTITSTADSVAQDFDLICLNREPNDGTTFRGRSITFQGDKRVKETLQFRIRENEEPEFELYALPLVEFDKAIANPPPDQGYKTGTDPIYGDNVIAIQFNNIKLTN